MHTTAKNPKTNKKKNRTTFPKEREKNIRKNQDRSVFAYENVMVQQCPRLRIETEQGKKEGKEMGKKRERDREYVKYRNINLKDYYRLEKNKGKFKHINTNK